TTEGADHEAIEERVGIGPWLSRVLRAPNRLAGETLGFLGVAEEPSRHAEMSKGVRSEVEGENRPKALVVPIVVIGERPLKVCTRAGEIAGQELEETERRGRADRLPRHRRERPPRRRAPRGDRRASCPR